VFALLLAVRRQWHQELTATDATLDAEARRITELYTRAADQLGSDKAPVRLAGLYALERLAQDNPGQRETIVSVVCAYLRMPYDVPGTPPAGDATREDYRDSVQEKQVRLTAQRILTTHLWPGTDRDHRATTFWPATYLDLTGATLIDFDLTYCWPAAALFTGARFIGFAQFDRARFAVDAKFDGAEFANEAQFSEAQFACFAYFNGAKFASFAYFDGARLARFADFEGTQFADAEFHDAAFERAAMFGGARFALRARFDSAVTFAPQEPKDACWVWLDAPPDVVAARSWPAGWEEESTQERASPAAEGSWGRLVQQPLLGPPRPGSD
jgi:hypothetical protein